MTSARCGRCRDPGPGRVRGRGGCPGSPWRAPATTAARVMLLHLATCSYTTTVLLYTYELFSEEIKILTTDYLHLHSTFRCKNIPYGQSSAKLVILSSCHPVILPSCHHVTKSSCQLPGLPRRHLGADLHKPHGEEQTSYKIRHIAP